MENTFRDDRVCFVCGEMNPIGLHLRIRTDPERGASAAEVTFRDDLQGWTGIVHGGFVATVYNFGDTADPYPGTTNKSTFSLSSTPNSGSYSNCGSLVAVRNIAKSLADPAYIVADLEAVGQDETPVAHPGSLSLEEDTSDW